MRDFSPALGVQSISELNDLESLEAKAPVDVGSWILHIDGAANVRGTGLGIVLESPQGDKIVLSLRLLIMRLNMKP